MDPQSRPAEFSSGGFGRPPPCARCISALPRCGTAAARVHFPQAERHDRFSGGQKGARKVGALSASAWLAVTASLIPIRPGTEEPPPASWPPALSWDVRLAETGQPCLPTAFLDGRGFRPAGTGSVANRSALHPTRLETRTKESNMRASRWVVRNPKAK